MKYVKYKFNYKNGYSEEYLIEIEPHEEKEMVDALINMNNIVNESMFGDYHGVIDFASTEGRVYIRVNEVQSFIVEGL